MRKTIKEKRFLIILKKKQASEKAIIPEKSFKKKNKGRLSKSEEGFLWRRVEELFALLPSELKYGNERFLNFKIVNFALIIAAFLCGFFFQQFGNFDSGKKIINILALPLLSIIIWNLAVYVFYLISFFNKFRKKNKSAGKNINSEREQISHIYKILFRFKKFNFKDLVGEKLSQSINDFFQNWHFKELKLKSKLFTGVVNFAAASFALGGLSALFAKAWFTKFLFTWESTLLQNERQVAAFLKVILSPGSLLGFAPPVETIAEMGAKLNGQPWLFSYAATIFVVVIIPRIFIFSVILLNYIYKNNHYSCKEELRAYLQYGLKFISGESEKIVILPYNYNFYSLKKEKLLKFINNNFGGKVQTEILENIPYGKEEEIKKIKHNQLTASYFFILTDFNTSPEEETNLSFIKNIKILFNNNKAINLDNLIMIMDTSDFEKKIEHLTDKDERILQRTNLWKKIYKNENIKLFFCSLDKYPQINDFDNFNELVKF